MPDISIGRILREPLFHFFLLGLGIFAIYDTGAPNGQNRGNGAQIVIDTQDVDRLVQQFEATWRRPPTQEELSALVSIPEGKGSISRSNSPRFYEMAGALARVLPMKLTRVKAPWPQASLCLRVVF